MNALKRGTPCRHGKLGQNPLYIGNGAIQEVSYYCSQLGSSLLAFCLLVSVLTRLPLAAEAVMFLFSIQYLTNYLQEFHKFTTVGGQ